jgi:hypothetical protein
LTTIFAVYYNFVITVPCMCLGCLQLVECCGSLWSIYHSSFFFNYVSANLVYSGCISFCCLNGPITHLTHHHHFPTSLQCPSLVLTLSFGSLFEFVVSISLNL